jgi:hypothetical protein
VPPPGISLESAKAADLLAQTVLAQQAQAAGAGGTIYGAGFAAGSAPIGMVRPAATGAVTHRGAGLALTM